MSRLKIGILWSLLVVAGCSDPMSPMQPTPPPTEPPPSGSGRFVATQFLAIPDFASAMVFTSAERILYTEKGGFGGVRSAASRHTFTKTDNVSKGTEDSPPHCDALLRTRYRCPRAHAIKSSGATKDRNIHFRRHAPAAGAT